MKVVFILVFSAVFLFISGCVSFSYSGEKGQKNAGRIAVFSDSAKIKRPYKVQGQAVVSGNYQHVSRDRMMEKLIREAGKVGADAVLIVEQQVLPAGMVSGGRGQGFFTAFDYDDSSRSWGELQRDVDVTIGNIGQRAASGSGTGGTGYKRIIRAEFLRFTGTAVPAAGK